MTKDEKIAQCIEEAQWVIQVQWPRIHAAINSRLFTFRDMANEFCDVCVGRDYEYITVSIGEFKGHIHYKGFTVAWVEQFMTDYLIVSLEHLEDYIALDTFALNVNPQILALFQQDFESVCGAPLHLEKAARGVRVTFCDLFYWRLDIPSLLQEMTASFLVNHSKNVIDRLIELQVRHVEFDYIQGRMVF